jgi:hypothetical protein
VAAEYLLRLDDACPTMDLPRWEPLLRLLKANAIRPLVAIVPSNTDPDLCRLPADASFWQRARSWLREGCMICLHGYSHDLRRSGGGLVPVNHRSEFVGLPVEEQRRRIAAGVRIMEANGLAPEVWVAPAHGFDALTLQALRLETDIRVISDGFMRRAVRRDDFVWLPQQLWRPRDMSNGLWTICLHPNEIDEDGLRALEEFVSSRHGSFPDPRDAVRAAIPFVLADAMFAVAFSATLKLRQAARRMRGNRK